jgi:DNA-binding NarL/FixJ family response regulator
VQNRREMPESVRVLLLEMPQLLRGILEYAIQRHSDCELMQDPRGVFQMLTDRTITPDVVIIGLTATEDATLVPALFARWPRVQVMTVMAAGEDAVVYELKPQRRTLGQMSPAEIVDTLRDAVHRNRALANE